MESPNAYLGEEPFVSLQGEGSRTGVMSLFVRLTGCNLHCTWGGESKCDTPYALSQKKTMPLSLNGFRNLLVLHKTTDVVFTGGEPLALWNRGILKTFAEEAFSQGRRVTVETNGTNPFFECENGQILWSISPKVGVGKRKESGEVVRLSEMYIPSKIWTYQIKLPVSRSTDYSQLLALMQLYPPNACDFYLMPVGTDPQALNQNIEKCLAWIRKNPEIKLSDRLHIRIWGDKKGT